MREPKTLLAVGGLLLIPLGFVLLYILPENGPTQHLSPPDISLAGPATNNPIPDCPVRIDRSVSRDLIKNESFTITMHVGRSDITQCENQVSVYAPGFDVKPESQKVSLPDKNLKKERDLTFTLLPKQAGSQIITVAYNGGEDKLGFTVDELGYVPPWLSAWGGPITSLLGGMLTIPWWIERWDKKREERTRKSKNSADQKRFGRLMEDGQRLYKKIADLRGEDLEAWDARLTEWQTSVHAALENIDFPADYQEFSRAADEIKPVAIGEDGKNLKWKQEIRRRKLQKQQQKLEEIVQRRLS